ncbi:MAG: NTP transferase domain-containing protein [Acidobacteriota bacterium]
MTAGLILSGGASQRMGQPKALLRLGSQTFLERLLELFDQFCSRTLVVTGAHHDEIIARIDSRRLVYNADHEQGMFSSLQCGLTALPQASRLLFSPVDIAGVSASTVAALFAAPANSVIKPRWRDQSGHPVLLAVPALAALRAADPSDNAKAILSGLPGSYVDVDDPFVALDCDTPADYSRLCSLWQPTE